jgi:hypothetical protein
LHEPRIVNGINNGEFSLSQRNQTGSVFKHSSFSSAGCFCRRLRCFLMEQTPNLCQP